MIGWQTGCAIAITLTFATTLSLHSEPADSTSSKLVVKVDDIDGEYWQGWTQAQQRMYTMGFQAGSFKVLEVLVEENKIWLQDELVQSLLLKYTNTHELAKAINAYYLEFPELLYLPVWWVVFSAKHEGEW